MPASDNPPFRAEHVGSLLRPQPLIDAMVRKVEGTIGEPELSAIQDKAIDEVIRLQEDLGLRAVTDGEYRRFSYLATFLEEGLGIEVSKRVSTATKGLEITRRLRWHPVHVRDFEYLKAHTSRLPKITLLGPCRVHWASGRDNISREVYPDMAGFWDDLIECARKELFALAAAGCTYVQIDHTTFAHFPDRRSQEMLAARGEDWKDLVPLYIDVMNQVVAGLPPTLTVGLHMCRGNSMMFRDNQHRAEGGYDLVAERMFNEMNIDLFFLEYDTARAGGFEPLRFLPRHKRARLGLVSTKVPALEEADSLVRRIEEAAKYADLDQLGICPQCGFASGFQGHPLTIEQEVAKLRRLVEVATRVWGSA